ncbi:hypothetical protein GmHk_17G049103 [Glycine max]|nr:hypothetical protein GmHk_17G049103 [Glycine max]
MTDPNKPTQDFSTCFALTHIFWETSQKVTHLITIPSQACLTVKFFGDEIPKSLYTIDLKTFLPIRNDSTGTHE